MNMITQKINFKSGNLRLEGRLSLPQGKGPFPALIVCHPHPLYGGNMDNYVVEAVCAQAEAQGLAWLKFNFRGVGLSEGNFAHGLGEKEDARAAVMYLANYESIDAERIGICGYSFGSLVAFQLATEEPKIKAVAGISPFIEPPSLLMNYGKPKLFVCGTEDEFIDADNLRALVGKFPEPKDLIFFPKANHFWSFHADQMAHKVSEFFRKYL
jgi:alpha/beta superfamily hydrolase